MHELQVTNVSPVVGISMIWIYGIGYVVAVVMALFNLSVLYRLLTGTLSEDELVQVVESEDVAHVAPAPLAGGEKRDGFCFRFQPAGRHGDRHADRLCAAGVRPGADGLHGLTGALPAFDSQILAQSFVDGADNFPLLAVPFFMLAGEIMNAGGLSRRIVNLAMAWVGHVRGGLGYVAVHRRGDHGGAVGLGGGRHGGAGRAADADDERGRLRQ